MTAPKLHPGEFDLSAELVRRLLAKQFPAWASLPLARVVSPGTVHVLYRLGEHLVVRLPRVPVAPGELDKEHAWLPRLAPHLPVPIPAPLARGAPTREYPAEWSVYAWLEGEHPVPGDLEDPDALARDLAAFIDALRTLDVTAGVQAPLSARGRRTLADLDAQARSALAQCRGLVDVEAAERAWEAARAGLSWDGQAVWVHADLLPGNLLVRGGRLVGVIDFGSLGTGDPASDLSVAWSILPAASRAVFREALGADEAAWRRARGLALVIALSALPYYLHTHPTFARAARFTVEQVLADPLDNPSVL